MAEDLIRIEKLLDSKKKREVSRRIDSKKTVVVLWAYGKCSCEADSGPVRAIEESICDRK